MSSAELMDQAVVNGTLTPLAEASISVLDLGFLRGMGVFETLRTYQGHPFAVRQHLDRLWQGAKDLSIPHIFDEIHFRHDISQAHLASGYKDLRINIIVTPGKHTGGVFGSHTPSYVLIVRELPVVNPKKYEQGVSCVSFAGNRHLPRLKTTTYITGRQGIAQAEQHGAEEALYVDENGLITEGVTSNVLLCKGHEIWSPDDESLPGITKEVLQTIAQEQGFTWVNRCFSVEDVYTADECWISSSIRELMPVVELDGKVIANGRVGPKARQLRQAFRDYCEAAALSDAQACP